VKKAKTFEERKIVRRIQQASAAAAGPAGGKKKAATTAADDKAKANKGGGGGGGGGGVDAAKLAQQLAAVRAIDTEALGAYMGTAIQDAVLANKDAPTADAALPTDGADATAAAKTAVGPAAVKVDGVQTALVVARRLLAAACVREEVTALQEKLVLVGDRQEWAKGRLQREEMRRVAKEEDKAKKEAAKEEEKRDKAESKARMTNKAPGDVDAPAPAAPAAAAARGGDDDNDSDDSDSDSDSDESDGSDGDGKGGGGGGGGGSERGDLNEEDWSSGGEDNGRPDVDSDSESDSDDIVIKDRDGELEKFLAAEAKENGDDDSSDDDDDGAGGAGGGSAPGEKKKPGAGDVCNKCGKTGHWARECPAVGLYKLNAVDP
jgi:uncharacterized membrane protein YgcG